MDFKYQADQDIKKVFHNSGEFAEITEFYLDNEPIVAKVVLDYSEYNDRKKAGSDNAEGLYNVDLIMYISLESLKKTPRKGQEIEINNECYTIGKVKSEMGEIILYLERLME
jgi:hypothetical protein